MPVVPNYDNKTLSDLPIGYNVWIASYTINEIKEFDTYSGGSTKVVVINKDGFNPIPDDKVLQYYNQGVDSISEAFSKALNDTEAKGLFKGIFPKDGA